VSQPLRPWGEVNSVSAMLRSGFQGQLHLVRYQRCLLLLRHEPKRIRDSEVGVQPVFSATFVQFLQTLPIFGCIFIQVNLV
jgi:hypothetical protein